jgi:phage-related protein
MNFLGLGFSFGGRDKNMSKTIENQTKHLGLMGTAVKTLDKILSINRLQTFLDAISLSRLKDISDGIESISSTGRNLTTTLEGEFQSNSRTMAAFGVNIGKTGADLKKFKKETSAAAYATGISIDEMGKAFYGFEPAGEILKSLGIEGGEAFAKLAEVVGADAQQLGWDLGQFQKETGLATEQMNLLVSQAVKMGKTTGDVGAALKKVPEMSDILNARKALGDSPEQITKFGQQIFGLGDALYGVGIKSGPDFSVHLAKTMNDTKKSFKGLLAGTEDDLNAFQHELMVSGISADKVFGAMEQGPADFVKVLAEQVSQVEANGGDVGQALEFMRARMGKAFGDEQTELLVNALKDPVKRGALAAVETLTKTTKVLGDIQKEGYEGRFTLAEQFERSEAMMVHRFRQIGREETKEFVRSSQRAFKQFGDTLQKVAAEKGPLGAIVRKMSEAHQIGAQAFIPEVMRPLVTLTGSAVKEMGPLLGILGSLGFRFTMLLNPINLVLIAGGALLAWFAALRMSGKSTDVALSEMGVKLMNFFYSIPRYVDEALDALAGFISGGPKSNVWTQVFDMVWNSIKSAAAHIWTRMKEIAAGFWDGFTNNVKSANTKTSSEIIGEKLGAVLRGALDRAWANLKKGVMDLASGQATGEGVLAAVLGLGTLMKFAGPVVKVLSVVGSVVGSIVSVLGSLGGVLVSVGGTLAGWVAVLADVASTALWVVSAITGVGEGVVLAALAVAGLTASFMLWPEKTQDAVNWVSGKLKWLSENAFEMLTTGIIMAIDWVVDALGGAGPGIVDTVMGWFLQLPKKFFSFVGEVGVALGKAINGILSMLEGLVLGALDGIKNALMKRFPASADVISNVFETVKGIVQDTFSVIKLGVTVVSEVFSTVFNLIGNVVGTVWNFIAGLTGWLIDNIMLPYFSRLWANAKLVFDGISWVVRTAAEGWGLIFKYLWEGVIKPVWDAVGPYFGAIWTGITSGLTRIQDAVRTIFGDVRAVTDATFGAIDAWVDGLFRNSISTDIEEDLKFALKFIENFGALAGKALDLVMAPVNALLPASMQIGGGEGAKAVPPAAKPSPALGADARDAALIAAVHQPAWYARYEQVFANRMDALIRTVEGAGAAAPGGKRPSGNRPGKTEAAGSNMGLYRNMGVDLTGGG